LRGDTLASALLANGVHLVGALLAIPPSARHHGRPVGQQGEASVSPRTHPQRPAIEAERERLGRLDQAPPVVRNGWLIAGQPRPVLRTGTREIR